MPDTSFTFWYFCFCFVFFFSFYFSFSAATFLNDFNDCYISQHMRFLTDICLTKHHRCGWHVQCTTSTTQRLNRNFSNFMWNCGGITMRNLWRKNPTMERWRRAQWNGIMSTICKSETSIETDSGVDVKLNVNFLIG